MRRISFENAITTAWNGINGQWDKTKNRRMIWFGLYSAVFLLLFAISYSWFVFGGRTFIWWVDGKDQLYPWLAYIGVWIRRVVNGFAGGRFSVPLFDLSIGWGDDVIGYLGANGMLDPISVLLSGLVPLEYAETLYLFLAMLRLYLAGLSFLFLCRHFGKQPFFALVGSIIYVFSGYSMFCATALPHCLNPMILFPLLIVGADKILRKDRPWLFVLSMFLSAVCGFYQLYMMSILLAVFVLFRFFDLYPAGERAREFFRLLCKGVWAYLLGIGLAAPLFFVYISTFLAAGRSGYHHFPVSTEFLTHWNMFWRRFLTLISPSSQYELEWGLDYPAYAAVTLPAIIVLLSSKGRRSLKWMIAIGFALLFIPFGGFAMNGFQYVCNRWAFGLLLALAYAVTEMLPELFRMGRRQKILCVTALCLYVLVGLFSSEMRNTVYAAVGAAFFAMSLLLFFSAKSTAWGSSLCSTRVQKAACLILVAANVCVNGLYICAPDSMSWSSRFAEAGEETKRIALSAEAEAAGYLSARGPSDGRTDSTLFHYNDAMLFGLPGTLFYTTSEYGNVIDYYMTMEGSGNVQNYKVYSYDQRTIQNALLSVKYQVGASSDGITLPYGYKPLGSTIFGYSIYENPYALPWGYTYDASVSYDSLAGLNGVEKQEVLLQAVALDEPIGGEAEPVREVRRIPYEIAYENCFRDNNILVCQNEEAAITLKAPLSAGQEYYVRVKGFNVNGYGGDFLSVSVNASFNFGVVCGDVAKRSRAAADTYPWYYGREDYLFCIGCSEKDRDTVTILIPTAGVFLLEDIELFALPMEHYPERIEALRAEPLEQIVMEDNRIAGCIDLSKEKVLCLSVPYSKGWTAYVDGKKTEILKANYAFMGLHLPAGHHEIEFRYCSPGLKAGSIVGLMSLGVVMFLIALDKRKAQKRRDRI